MQAVQNRNEAARRLARRVVPSRLRPSARRVARQFTQLRSHRPEPTTFALAPGLVERFDAEEVSGWVAVEPGAAPTQVSLRLNGRPLVSFEALDPIPRDVPDGEARRFRLTLGDVWDYCRPRDRLSVEVDGLRLPISGHGTVFAPTAKGAHTPTDLFEAMGSGHVFSRDGVLKLSPQNDRQWQRDVLGLAAEVRQFIHDRLGYDLFLTYGALLGAIRERSVISHDTDIDMAYVSRHRTGPAAAAEFADLALAFIEDGWIVEPYRAHLHIDKIVDGRLARIDVFHHFFDEAGVLSLPYGVAGEPGVSFDDWQGVVEIDFLGFPVLVPAQSEQVLAQIYGTSWRSPQPGFSWAQDRRTRAESGRIPRSVVKEIYWANYYAHAEVAGPSSFAEFLLGRDGLPGTVVDIGCGNGRDAIAFAATGRNVTGIDGAPVAIRRATAAAGAARLDVPPVFEVCDVRDVGRLGELLAGARRDDAGAVLFYLRFFLHSIGQGEQDALLEAIAAAARPGDLLAAEFRTLADEGLEKVQPDHFRRYQDGAELAAALHARFGFEIEYHHEGTGLSPYGSEDPVLCRIVARAS